MDRVRGGWTTRNNSLNLIRSRQASTWFLRAACAVRFRFFIRLSGRASVSFLSCCLFLSVILNACFDAISGRVNNAVRCSRDAWSRVWIRPVVESFAKDTVDCRTARRRESVWKKLLLREFIRRSLLLCDKSMVARCFPHSFKRNQWQFRRLKRRLH